MPGKYNLKYVGAATVVMRNDVICTLVFRSLVKLYSTVQLVVAWNTIIVMG